MHSKLVSQVQDSRHESDVFPTYYKCNTKRKLKKILDKYLFESIVYCYESEPSYLSFSRFFYFLGVLHQRFMPNIFKLSIFAFAKKKE